MNAGRTKRCMRAIRTRFGLLDGGFESPVRAFLRTLHPPGYPGQVAVAAFERAHKTPAFRGSSFTLQPGTVSHRTFLKFRELSYK